MSQDFKTFLSENKSFLITYNTEDNIHDSLCAAFGLALVLDNANKNVVCKAPKMFPQKLKFLEQYLKPIFSEEHATASPPRAQISINKAGVSNLPVFNINKDGQKSACEILTRNLKPSFGEYINKTAATCFLAGLIAYTQNFQSRNTRPQSLFAAAYLISKGADNEEAVRHMYKVKPAEFIKLWGSAISRFTYNPATKVGWTYLSKDDLQKTSKGAAHVPHIINELKANFAEAETYAVGFEHFDKKCFVVAHSKQSGLFNEMASFSGTEIKNNSLFLPLEDIYDVKTATHNFVKQVERSFKTTQR